MSNSVIYVIDDDASVCKSLQRLLSISGFTVETFGSAIEFLQKASPGEHDCLLVDIHMPQMSGIELKIQLNQQQINTPVVFLTAFDSDKVRDDAKAVGGVGYLRKPFDNQALIDNIKFAIQKEKST
jgi:two-component system, LuxR family, response regulator FixJ